MNATVVVKDPEKFQQYLAKTQEVAKPYRAELLLRAKVDTTLTGGDNDHSLVVIVKFPSIEKIHEWYESDAYRLLIPLRDEGSQMKMTSYEILG